MQALEAFRAYDVRAVVGPEFDAQFAYRLGLAVGRFLKKKGMELRMTVGMDARVSSPSFESAYVQGLKEEGLKVRRLGLAATPLCYFASFAQNDPNVTVITASHNPAAYNGFKFILNWQWFFGPEILELREYFKAVEAPPLTLKEDPNPGFEAAFSEVYLEAATQALSVFPKSSPMKVVLDGSNGSGGPLAERLFQRLGFDLIPMFTTPDGTFPAHEPDPSIQKNMEKLRQSVLSNGADLGVMLDGDADRLGVIDRHGRAIPPDELILALSQTVQAQAAQGFVLDVKCTPQLLGLLKNRAILHLSPTGHPNIKQTLKDKKAVFGAEYSGHIVFNDGNWYPTDDAIYAAARLACALRSSEERMKEFETNAGRFKPTLSTEILSLPIKEAHKATLMTRLSSFPWEGEVSRIDGLRVEYGGLDWFLLRLSNTSETAVFRIEAETPERFRKIQSHLKAALEEASKGLEMNLSAIQKLDPDAPETLFASGH